MLDIDVILLYHSYMPSYKKQQEGLKINLIKGGSMEKTKRIKLTEKDLRQLRMHRKHLFKVRDSKTAERYEQFEKKFN